MDRNSSEFEYARLSQGVRASVRFHMQERNISRAQLAREMGVTPSRVTQILSGEENLTLRTLGALAACLHGRFVVELVPDDARPVAASGRSPSPRNEHANSGR